MRTPLLIALITTSLLAVACGPSAALQTPDGFAKLDDQEEYAYRATSAEGVVLGVRAVDNSPKGNLEFWVGAVDRQLRKTGYSRDGEGAAREVTSAGGVRGRELRFTREDGGRPYRFWIAVFVTDAKVYLVEAGGDDAHFDKRTMESVEKAIASATLG